LKRSAIVSAPKHGTLANEGQRSHVILSEAKDLMPVASGDEVLRSASAGGYPARDDRTS